MTLPSDQFNDYYQGPQRKVIQHPQSSKGKWIVWNWRTACWDTLREPVGVNGEFRAPAKED